MRISVLLAVLEILMTVRVPFRTCKMAVFMLVRYL